MEKLRFIIVATSALAIGGALAIGSAQAAVQGGADVMRAASENGAITEQVQYRFGGYDYCWADDGWRGPGWYWCGYAHRSGFGWGGPVGWNSWRFRDHDDRRYRDRDDFRERGEFREHREFREHEHEHEHEHEEGRRYY